MPGAWKTQPAPGKARGFRGQDTVERHGGRDPVVDKIDQAEEEAAALSGAGMVDDFRLWGSSRCRRMTVTLSEGGGDIEG